ncbi:hypothetical protein [Idiomarina sp.]|jgi:hypothetical protein|uniref:hypothetical protein n=1 Tax=Idiomarina sp. TaxID=1874361 RepID=UPI002589A44C|nr:hypothetical protein [Idiomarina sp.]|tara:strand:+ start:1559 stop:2101 length:543 start_codon:yes stop_codon:yes gene_type:complete
MQKEDRLINELNKIIEKPGGKQAVRYVLNAMGGIPVIGGAIAGVGGFWGEREQQEFNETITNWASQADTDIAKLLEVLGDQLREPTKAHLAILIGEITGLDISSVSEESHIPVILNGETVSDLQPYVQKGWISLRSNGNVANMGAGNRIGNSIEDRKRPWGMGNGFTLIISDLYLKCSDD